MRTGKHARFAHRTQRRLQIAAANAKSLRTGATSDKSVSLLSLAKGVIHYRFGWLRGKMVKS